MKKPPLLALIFLLLAAPAAAENLSPRPEITLDGRSLTLGDVFPGAKNEGHVLAPAPRPGETLTLGTEDLRRISDAFGLRWSPSSSGARTVVKSRSIDIGRAEMEAALAGEMRKRFKGRSFDMRIGDRAADLHLPPDASPDLTVDSLAYDLGRGEFRATLSAAGVKKELAGRIYAVTEVPVLRQAMRAGDVISDRDIDYVSLRDTDLSDNVIVDAEKLKGLTPRRGISAMKPVTAADVVLPNLVKKGEVVTMTLNRGNIRLTAQGKALEDGAEGETVRILNNSSRLTVEAVVTGLKTVSVRTDG